MTLPFKTDRPPVPGCSYAVVQWRAGGALGKGPGTRSLVSCQRSLANARKALAMAKQNEKDKKKMMKGLGWHKLVGKPKFAIYSLKTGKKVK